MRQIALLSFGRHWFTDQGRPVTFWRFSKQASQRFPELFRSLGAKSFVSESRECEPRAMRLFDVIQFPRLNRYSGWTKAVG